MHCKGFSPFVRSIVFINSEAKLDSFIIIFLSCEDDFVSLRAGILQVNSKEIELKNDNLENDMSQFSESAFSAEK